MTEKMDNFTDDASPKAGVPTGISKVAPMRDESKCDHCGAPNPVWFAPNDLWNAVVGSEAGFLCPNCFIGMAEDAGFTRRAWCVCKELPDGALHNPQLVAEIDATIDRAERENARLREALKFIAEYGGEWTTGEGHAKCRYKARAALAETEGK